MTDEPRSEENPVSTSDGGTATETPEPEKSEKLLQTVEFRDIGPCKKHIKVTIARPSINVLLDEKYTELGKQVAVPGFRAGKAPRRIVERRFKSEVNDQVKSKVLLQSLEQLAEESDLAALSPPDIDPVKIEIPKDGPLIYEFDVEVRPQFDLPNYKALRIKRPIKTFTAADIDREEHRLLEPHGQQVPKEGNPPTVDLGDYLIADVVFQSGGQTISQLIEAKIRVQPRLIFKDGVAERFGAQVQGAKPGETRTVDVRMSSHVADSGLRGQAIQAVFAVKDIKTIRLPEKSHALMHEFGVHSPEQLRELIGVILERRLAYQQRQAAREQIVALIAKTANWDLPQDLLMRQAKSALRRRVMEMRSAGISDEEIASRQRLLQQDVLASAEQSLKEHFVFQKIAEAEKIEITEDDLNEEIERIAAKYDESPRRVRAQLEKEDMLEALAAEIIENKVLDVILQTAEYEDVPLEPSEDTTNATLEEQMVPGEMKDPTASPPTAAAEAPKPAGQ